MFALNAEVFRLFRAPDQLIEILCFNSMLSEKFHYRLPEILTALTNPDICLGSLISIFRDHLQSETSNGLRQNF